MDFDPICQEHARLTEILETFPRVFCFQSRVSTKTVVTGLEGNFFFNYSSLLTILKVHYHIPSLPHYTTIQHYYLTTLLPYYITSLLHYCITLLHYYITTVLYYYITNITLIYSQ